MVYQTTTSVFNYLVGYKSSDTVTANIVSESIDDATNEINKYVGERYDTTVWSTLTATPPIIKTICKWYAAGLAIEACGRGGKEAQKRSEVLIKRATENLKDIESGKLSISDTSGSLVAKTNDPNEVFSTTDDYSNTFNEDSPTLWSVSPQKRLDIASEREE